MISLIFLSCEKEEVCDCLRTPYKIIQYTYFENGLPKVGFRHESFLAYPTGCDESEGTYETSATAYYTITCD